MAPGHDELIVYERHVGVARAPLGATYRRREPERTILYSAVEDHLQTFLAAARAEDPGGHGLPSFVEREFTRYLDCGILAHGFVRVRCDDCGPDRLVAFSCRGRAICPPCNTRRMHNTAAHLVDRVLRSGATYRQWVLSLPRWVRFKLAYQPKCISLALEIFVRAIFSYQRRRARRQGIVDARPGSVTSIQRFGSALNLNIHFHVLAPDGVFTERTGEIAFVGLGPPTNDEVEAIVRKIARRTLALMERVDDSRGASSKTRLIRTPLRSRKRSSVWPVPPSRLSDAGFRPARAALRATRPRKRRLKGLSSRGAASNSSRSR